MDNISFSNPNGFPLEADATLGFMQNNYVTSVNGLAATLGDLTIVSGLEVNGSALTDGWIFIGGDLVFFQGGAPVDSFYIESTVVQKANSNGVLFDRYFTKRAKFGTSATLTNYSFATLTRLNKQSVLQSVLLSSVQFENQIVLFGCVVSGTTTFSITVGLVILDGKIIASPALSSSSVTQYLSVDSTQVNRGKFTTTAPSTGQYITFDSTGCSQYYADIIKRNSALAGEVRMIVTASTYFDSTGLGISRMKGWAICNGANGTFDFTGRFPIGLDAAQPITSTIPQHSSLGQRGGLNEQVLTKDNMPPHNHSTTNDVSQGGYGLVRRSIVGESNTIAGSVDSQDSGNQPDLISTPHNIQVEGSATPFSILPSYTTVLFIQRI